MKHVDLVSAINSKEPRLKAWLLNLFCLFIIPVKLVLDCDQGTGIYSLFKSYRDKFSGFLLTPAGRQAGMTYKKSNFSSPSKDGVFKSYFNKFQ
ncbi:MAG: hypothetical protein A2042_02615 [Candidatus Schekmanbacteria bacterium GWA2_38_11]|uniref:Uncharacterized protein n=1 Tax=Candidatus Schekmanbacteria bacterium GWA2_38_11 TaxID=1817876 RepID=A0A1F7R9P2_9BACT|nr:MAG: hypothetical protein A2042_02615 [Candidatus Schekmanbacteria bacterium GWA2_38_11]